MHVEKLNGVGMKNCRVFMQTMLFSDLPTLLSSRAGTCGHVLKKRAEDAEPPWKVCYEALVSHTPFSGPIHAGN